jgi:hypothetical protein
MNNEIKFEIVPQQIAPKSSKYFVASYQPQPYYAIVKTFHEINNKYSLIRQISFDFKLSSICDWRLNILEISSKEDFILIASNNIVVLIKFDKLNLNFEKPFNLYESNDQINQIKLMSDPSDPEKEYLIVLNDFGYITVHTIENYIITKTKFYTGHINSNDNSVWSVDCCYPYIIIGGNHKCVMVFNILKDEDEENINHNNNILHKQSVIYKGNNHNVPCVSISGNKLFIANNSIDSYVKVFDFYKGDMLISIPNDEKQWGWGVKFIPKNLFNIEKVSLDEINIEEEESLTSPFYKYIIDNDNFYKSKAKINNDNDVVMDEEILDYNERFIKNNLLDKYYILSTYQKYACLNELYYGNNVNENNKREIKIKSLGKILLLKRYLNTILLEKPNVDNYTILVLKNLSNYSKYEFIHFSEYLKLMFIIGRNGDLHIQEMVIEKDEDKQMIGIRDQPEFLVEFGEKIVGVKFFDKIINPEIYVLTLTGKLYNFKISKK